VGIEDKDGYHSFDVEYSGFPYGDSLGIIKSRIENADLLIGFNIKFDLHWIRRYISDVVFPPVFDCQLAEFLLSGQSHPYPALDSVCSARGLGNKRDIVKVEYWDNGIDTPDIPIDILAPYLRQDVALTKRLFEAQRQELVGHLRRLASQQFEDLLVLQEMEWNGMLYDTKRAAELATLTREKIRLIDEQLVEISGSTSISFNSDDHISCLLYGGSISIPFRESYTRTLKSGKIVERERWANRTEAFSQLVKPIRGTETKPTCEIMGDGELDRINGERIEQGKKPFERHYSVAEPVLRQLRATGKAKRIIELMLERSKLGKLDSTYYSGLLGKFGDNEWEGGILHGQFNQTVARTGRLSSSGPNLQNFSGDIKELFGSRYV
jgi:DNA polymerase I-like protein with 3'-5' exonuclease and polymerase domains